MTAIATKVELEGNFFRHDPGKTLYADIGDMLEALSGEMERAARGEIGAHEGEMRFWTGWSQAHTLGYTTSAKTGKHWALWAAVGVPTTGMSREAAIRTKAAAASIERRWHPFRDVKGAVYRARALISANLTKNLE